MPFPSSSTLYSEPLQLIESDLWGPSPVPSILCFKYYVIFIDAYSRFTWLYLLKTKSEVHECFVHFKTQVELQLNTKITQLQTNWGGEFRSLTPLLQRAGIIHRVFCPHTSEQNGIVERKHRHVVELGLLFLLNHPFLLNIGQMPFPVLSI